MPLLCIRKYRGRHLKTTLLCQYADNENEPDGIQMPSGSYHFQAYFRTAFFCGLCFLYTALKAVYFMFILYVGGGVIFCLFLALTLFDRLITFANLFSRCNIFCCRFSVQILFIIFYFSLFVTTDYFKTR